MRAEFSRATRLPNLACETVTALWRLTTQTVFSPSSSLSKTSEGTPRIADVIGAMVTVLR